MALLACQCDRVQSNLNGAVARRREGAHGLAGVVLLQPAMIAASALMPVMSGRKFDTDEPAALNADGSFEPSPPNTFASCPADQLAERTSERRPALRREEHDVGIARHLGHVCE